jgi:hypothetical protein
MSWKDSRRAQDNHRNQAFKDKKKQCKLKKYKYLVWALT